MSGNGSHLVNSELIGAAVSGLRGQNQSINNDFEGFKKKAGALESKWNSAAGSRACTQMYQLFKVNETRSSVLQNYINILEQQVSPGYISAENANTTLADQFK